MITTIIVFLFTLLILVLVHEFGHFIVAKKFGIKVLEFGFGLPPRAWGKKIGETLVSINWLPFGGFVRLLGEDEVDEKTLKAKDSFAAQPVQERMGVVVAGVTMNFILAFILFWIILGAQGFTEKLPLLIPHQFVGVNQVDEKVILIGQVASDSPAATAGITSGDQAIAFNDVKLTESDQLVDLIKSNAGEKVTLTLKDTDGKTRQVEITPRKNPPAGQGALGVQLGTITIAHLNYTSLTQKIVSGPVHAYNLTAYSFDILGNLISTSFKNRDLEPVSQSVSGPVGLTNITGTIIHSKSPFIPYLNFIAILSLNLAIINILPFPALDGGRLFFLILEAVLMRKIKPEIEKWVHTIGFAILIGLIILITISDIKKFF